MDSVFDTFICLIDGSFKLLFSSYYSRSFLLENPLWWLRLFLRSWLLENFWVWKSLFCFSMISPLWECLAELEIVVLNMFCKGRLDCLFEGCWSSFRGYKELKNGYL